MKKWIGATVHATTGEFLDLSLTPGFTEGKSLEKLSVIEQE